MENYSMKRIPLLLLGLFSGSRKPPQLTVQLTEWKVTLSQTTVAAGPVTFIVTNTGQIPHAVEVEGAGVEQEIETIQPGATDTLTVTLTPGRSTTHIPARAGGRL